MKTEIKKSETTAAKIFSRAAKSLTSSILLLIISFNPLTKCPLHAFLSLKKAQLRVRRVTF